jgi:hypothetical protein
MNPEAMESLRGEIEGKLRDQLDTLREHAEHFAVEAVDEMIDKGTAIELTEDEERMLQAYRVFRQRNSEGVFSWQMPVDKSLITELPEPALLRDPREVSAT